MFPSMTYHDIQTITVYAIQSQQFTKQDYNRSHKVHVMCTIMLAAQFLLKC